MLLFAPKICFVAFLTLKRVPVAELIDLDGGDNVNFSMGLSYRPTRQHGLAGAGTTTLGRSWLYPPSQGSMNSGTDADIKLNKCRIIGSEAKLSLLCRTSYGRSEPQIEFLCFGIKSAESISLDSGFKRNWWLNIERAMSIFVYNTWLNLSLRLESVASTLL